MSISLQLQQSGDEKRRSPGSIPPRRVWKPQTHWVIADWLGLMEPACGESCPSGQRRGPGAPGEDKLPSISGSEILPYLYNSNNRDENADPPRRYRPARCGNPNPTGWLLVTNWLRLMEPARGESCLSGQLRGPAAPEEDRVSSPDYKSSHISTTPTTRR